MGSLRERISFFKIADGEVLDLEKDGRWVDVVELLDGGARISVKIDDLECLHKLCEKLKRLEVEEAQMIVSEKEDWLVLVDNEGKQISYGVVMKALFD